MAQLPSPLSTFLGTATACLCSCMIGHAIDQNNFYTMPSDPSLENPPQVDYPVEIPSRGEDEIEEPEPQSNQMACCQSRAANVLTTADDIKTKTMMNK